MTSIPSFFTALRTVLKVLLISAVLAGLCLPSSHATLIALWDFNQTDSSALTSDIGGYTFSQTGNGGNQTTTYNGGSVSLGSGRELVATGINSTDMPALTTGVTLWARVKYDTVAANDGFYLGLVNSTVPATSGDVSLGARHTASSGDALQGITSTPTTIGQSSSYFTMPATGTYFNLALTFSPGASSSTVTMYVDGTSVARTGSGTSMQAFSGLALGRLISSANIGSFTFDEVRVYDTVLTAGEIAAIPEPSTWTLALPSALLVYLLARVSSRRTSPKPS